MPTLNTIYEVVSKNWTTTVSPGEIPGVTEIRYTEAPLRTDIVIHIPDDELPLLLQAISRRIQDLTGKR